MADKSGREHADQQPQPIQQTTPSKLERAEVSKEDHVKEREQLSEMQKELRGKSGRG